MQRNKANSLLRREKRQYLNNLFNNDVIKKSDVIWKRINGFLGRGDKNTTITEITLGDKVLSNETLANTFNNYFTTLVNSTHDPNSLSYLRCRTKQSAFLAPTTENEVFTTFMSIKNSRCCDVEGFEIMPIKHVLDLILPALVHIINLIFSRARSRKDFRLRR